MLMITSLEHSKDIMAMLQNKGPWGINEPPLNVSNRFEACIVCQYPDHVIGKQTLIAGRCVRILGKHCLLSPLAESFNCFLVIFSGPNLRLCLCG